MASRRILLVDDDRLVLESMGDWLTQQGYLVVTASGYEEALARLHEGGFQLVVTDIRLGLESGLELLKRSRQLSRETPVILISGYATLETGIAALRAGASDLLTKPLIDEELSHAMERALSGGDSAGRKVQNKSKGFEKASPVIGHKTTLRKTFEIIEDVADTKATILITGESGTGKSLIARSIHQQSSRSQRPFVEVACGALPETLLESELFGYVAGAFTGAVSDREGKFARADGGTIFLDEISTASPRMQVKLLRFLQEFAFEPVGGTATVRVDTRVILATNDDLIKAVHEERFRRDLYYRVNVINIQLPALRERSSDIPALCDYFLELVCQETGKQDVGFSEEAIDRLQKYAWPGNVRELQNVVERAVLLSRDSLIEPSELSVELQVTGEGSNDAYCYGQTLKQAMEEPERKILREALLAFEWNRIRTADSLGINRTTLYKKMKRLGLDLDAVDDIASPR